ncbi:MAG: hypothetical protein N3A69_07460 [Leptospiraceae bacterium]|nr:hypothetical protein [Leptospiraceae bacterium]
MKRATLSLHELSNSKHYDLFLEKEESLITLEISFQEQEIIFSGKPLPFVLKPNHRKIYLDYEGELSQNRGRVQIIWQGFWTPEEDLANKSYVQFIKNFVKFS